MLRRVTIAGLTTNRSWAPKALLLAAALLLPILWTTSSYAETCSPRARPQAVGPGVLYYDCKDKAPSVQVITIDRGLRNMHLKLLSVASDDSDTLNLRSLKTHAEAAKAIVAINGYFWSGDKGLDPCLVLGCKTGKPDTTVFIDGVRRTIPKPGIDKEVLMGFAANATAGIQARRILQEDLFSGENRPYRQWLYGSEKTVIGAGVFNAKEKEGDNDYQSITGYSKSQIILLITNKPYYLADLKDTLSAFGTTDAVRNDGGSSVTMYIGGNINRVVDPPRRSRRIAYGIGLVPGMGGGDPSANGDTMQPGQLLNRGQSIRSRNGKYSLAYQTDDNLVLYRNDGAVLWASGTSRSTSAKTVMQSDGNLVVHDPGGKAIWASGTSRHPGSHLVVQDDGNLVIYEPGGRPIWATHTDQTNKRPVARGDDMRPGEVLNPNQSLFSASRRYKFVYQGDGNLVLYRNADGRPLWASNTARRPTGVVIQQADGNLVIYGPDRAAIWASNTAKRPGSRLIVQNDGNVVIYAPGGKAVWATNTAQPSYPRARGDAMRPGQALHPGEAITSRNGRYRFIYQSDGNLVLYRRKDGRPLWASNTHRQSTGVMVMQTDGNAVVYRADNRPVWASGTAKHRNSRLVVQDDGNVVIYDPGGRPVWATNTVQRSSRPVAQGDDMRPGETLTPNRSILSANRRYKFVYQSDGNLVLYRTAGGKPLWASNTANRRRGHVIQQTDGNLVIYDPSGKPIWASGTSRHPGSRLVVQNDGNVVIYAPGGKPVWASNTVQ
jgi:hypothetical protein